MTDQAEEIKRLRKALKDMCDLAEEGSQYKGEYLAKKHRDAKYIAEARAILAGKEEEQ